MLEQESAETTGLRLCQACGAEQLGRDKFCRRCGIQNGLVAPSRTGPLSGTGSLRRSYSGPLIGIVAQKLSEDTSSFRSNRWAMLLISMMVAVPLWLMIVLLSPLDAYVAAKDLSKQV